MHRLPGMDYGWTKTISRRARGEQSGEEERGYAAKKYQITETHEHPHSHWTKKFQIRA